MAEQGNIWPKKITVDKRIVTILSGSTYDNFPRALKEIITNSYDADATTVKITIDQKKQLIVVEDNGVGMTETDFDFYLRIAGKSRARKEVTVGGRQRIGQFGVGFLSVFPFSRTYKIESKKKGSPEILFATIPTDRYFKPGEKGTSKLSDVDQIPIQGGKRNDPKQINNQYTKITLEGFTELTSAFFNKAYQVTGKRDTILNYEPIKRVEWELAEDLPIAYDEKHIEINKKFPPSGTLPFHVYLNSEPLVRNLHANNILETNKGEFQTIGKIKFKYFIASDYKPVKPVQGRFFKIRNHNVGVGNRDTFGVGLEGKTYAFLSHLTGEIHVLEGLNDLINVARDNFNFSHDYEALKEFFRQKLRHWGNELDTISRTEKLSADTEDDSRTRSLSSLSREKLQKTVDDFKSKGYTVKKQTSTSDKTPVFKIDKGKKEIIVYKKFEEEELTKKIQINGKNYVLKLEKWDTEDEFPACRIRKNTILLNENYTLFEDGKHLDIFIKVHAILALSLENGEITRKGYRQLLTNLEVTFAEYF